ALTTAPSLPSSTAGCCATSGLPQPMPNSSAASRSGGSDATSVWWWKRLPEDPTSTFPTIKEEQIMTTPDSLRYVEGELNYLVPMAERPRYFAYDAGPDAPTNMAHEAHTVRIRDMRPISHEVTLDRYGFALVEQRTAMRDFWNDDEVHEV